MTPVVRALLAANVALFFVQMTMPELARPFIFVPQLVLFRPWTIVTYMFLHGGLTHLLFNMLALFFFGPRVEERLGSRSFATMYFIAGITGALCSFFFAPTAQVIGASAGVYGVMLAFAHYWPREPIYIWGVLPVPARVLVIITTLITLWSGFGGGRSGIAHFAHLGGYVGAFVYLRWLDRSRARFRREATAPLAPPVPRREPPRRVAGVGMVDRSGIHEVNRAEVDRILDKINATGVESLTPKERVFLSNFVPMDDRRPPVS